MDRGQQFNEFAGFNFSELDKIRFKSGCQPRNATDYYYRSKTKMMYSYYFGEENGHWEDNANIDLNKIKSPSILCTTSIEIEPEKLFRKNKNPEKTKQLISTSSEKTDNTSDNLKILELKFKLSENYKLELEVELLKLEIQKLDPEKKLIELQIKLEEMKQKHT